MSPLTCKPVEIFARVMHGVEPPKKGNFVAKSMTPIDQKFTKKKRPCYLQPNWLGLDEGRESRPLKLLKQGVQKN